MDGGFSKLPFLVDPTQESDDIAHTYCEEWLESIRKDVECFFGVLKSRFRFFRNGIRYHSEEVIEDAMKTACILHNLMLTVDGLNKFNWECVDPDNDNEEEDDEEMEEDNLDAIVSKKFQPPVVTPTTIHGITLNPKEPQHYWLLKRNLVTNFIRQYQIGDVHWPRKMKNYLRAQLPKTPPPVARLEEARVTIPLLPGNQHKSLYTKQSDLRRKAADGEYRLLIGKGLFSSLFLKKDTNLGQFEGEIIDQATFDSREAAGLGGYCIALGSGNYLDCYPAVQQGQCMLSLANDARQCYNREKSDEQL
jgi:Plant transposon protein